jgi:hypothetical protein
MPRVKIGLLLPDNETLDIEIARLRDLDVRDLGGPAAPSPVPVKRKGKGA